MKNKLNLLLFLFLFMFCTMKVEAVTVTKSNIDVNSYIIGNHLFTTASNNSEFQKAIESSDAIYSSSTGLRTEMIMLGASSIDGAYSDMLIYYKDFFNTWYNPITFTTLASSKVPSKFEIYYVNGVCVDPSCNGGTKTISFYYNNGYVTTPKQVNVNIGSPIPASDIPNVQPPVGASLKYWSIKNISSAFDFSTEITTDLSLEANWNYYKYDITYVNTINNNATKTVNDCTFGSSSPCTYGNYDSLFGTIPIGYTFVGWSDKKTEGTVYKDLDSMKNLFGPSDSAITLYSVFESEDFIYEYKLNGGVFGDDTKISYTYDSSENKITDLATPTRSGYTFAGWKVEGQTSSSSTTINHVDDNGDLIIIVPSKITLVAQWTPIKYSFDRTDDTNNDADITCIYDQKCTIPVPPAPAGKKFLYWTTNHASLEKVYTDVTNIFTSTPASIIGITPVYEDIKYSVTYNYNGGSVSGVNVSSATYNENITLVLPTRVGYTFDGWSYNGASGTKNISSTTVRLGIVEDVLLTANWSIKLFEISYNLNGGSVSGTTLSNTSCSYASCKIPDVTPTRAAYVFEGWEYNGYLYQPGSDVTIDATGTITFKAKWSNADKYNIKYTLNGGTFGANPTTSFLSKESVDLAIPSRIGYTFTGWTLTSGNGSVNKTTTGNVDKYTLINATTNVTVSASWLANNYSVKLHKDPSGSDSSNPLKTITCRYDEDCTLLDDSTHFDDEFSNYNFLGWATTTNGDVFYGNGVAVRNISTGDEVNLYPVLVKKDYTITYYLDGGKFSDNSKKVVSFNAGDSVGLTIPVKENYKFVGWELYEGDTSTATIENNNDSYTLKNATSNVVLLAQWELITQYQIIMYSNGPGTESVVTSCIFGEDCEIPTVNFTNVGYDFDGWYHYKTSSILFGEYDDNAVLNFSKEDFRSMGIYRVDLLANWSANEIPIEYYFDGTNVTSEFVEAGLPDTYTMGQSFINFADIRGCLPDYSIASWSNTNDLPMYGDETSFIIPVPSDGKKIKLYASSSGIFPNSSPNVSATFIDEYGDQLVEISLPYGSIIGENDTFVDLSLETNGVSYPYSDLQWYANGEFKQMSNFRVYGDVTFYLNEFSYLQKIDGVEQLDYHTVYFYDEFELLGYVSVLTGDGISSYEDEIILESGADINFNDDWYLNGTLFEFYSEFSAVESDLYLNLDSTVNVRMHTVELYNGTKYLGYLLVDDGYVASLNEHRSEFLDEGVTINIDDSSWYLDGTPFDIDSDVVNSDLVLNLKRYYK